MDDQEYLRLLERTFSADERKTMAANGMAMNDGSYPIASVADLSNAVQAYGRSPDQATKNHIIKRARALKRTDLLPKDWEGSTKESEDPESDDTLTERTGGVVFLEAVGKTGAEWDVLLITSGVSLNKVNYSPAVLREATSLYEGVAAYADHPDREGFERSIRDKVGAFRHVKFEERTVGGRVVEGITGRLKVVTPWLREALLEAHRAGEPDFYGLSHNVSADWNVVGGVKEVKRIYKVHSVDVVTDPAAGGRIERLVASNGGNTVELTPEQLQEMMAKAAEEGAKHALEQAAAAAAEATKTGNDPPPGGDGDPPAPTGDAAGGEQAAAQQTATAVADPPADGGNAGASEAAEALKEARALRDELRKRDTIARIDSELKEANLTQPSKDIVRKRLGELLERRWVEEADIRAVLQEQQQLEASLIQESHNPRGLGGTFRVGDDYRDKVVKGLDGWFDMQPVDGVKPVGSLKEAYCRFSGVDSWDFDAEVMMESFGGNYRSGRDHKRLMESMTTSSWGEIFADRLYIKLMKEYQASPYQDWQKLVSDYDDVPDFQTRHWARVGGYGNLPAVAEQGTYLPTTSPTDEEITFAITKRGFLDDVTFEMIVGDRLNKVRRLPAEMALAAARTLYRFVLDMITTDNAVMDYDSVALYNSAHNNTGTTALSVAGVDAVAVAMRSQTRYATTAEILGPRNMPRFIIVPNELESRAMRIVNPSDAYLYAVATPADTETVMDPQRFKNAGLEVIVYDHLTDATDWWVVADPSKVSTVVMGFLNGNREPELFAQDQPNVGSAFTADKVTYKIRHIFGGDIQDHRSVYRQVVA